MKIVGSNSEIIQSSWPELRNYLNGISASLAYGWCNTQDNLFYQIYTEPYIGFAYTFYMEKTGSTDQTDFETNWKNNPLRNEGSKTAIFLSGSSNSITGSVSVLNTVNVNFSDPAEGITGSTPPSRAIFVGGYDAGSVAMRAFSVDSSGKLNVNATAAGSPNVGGTGSSAPTSASLGGAIDGSGILRPFLSDGSGRQIIQVFNTASITGSVGLVGFGSSIVSGTPALRVDVVQTVGGSSTNPSVGLVNATVPVSATVVGGTTKNGILQDLLLSPSGVLSVQTTGLAIASGDISGSLGVTYGQATISATSETPVRSTTYSEQATNGQRSVKSSAATDANANTGARQVMITYFDQNGSGPFQEIIALNGTTAVATVNSNICYISKFEIIGYGSTGIAAGVITLHSNNSGGGTTIATISLGRSIANYGMFYYGANKKCFLTSFIGNSTTSGRFTLRVKEGLNSQTTQYSVYFLRSVANQTVGGIFETPILLPTGSFFRVQVHWGGDATTATTVGASLTWMEMT